MTYAPTGELWRPPIPAAHALGPGRRQSARAGTKTRSGHTVTVGIDDCFCPRHWDPGNGGIGWPGALVGSSHRAGNMSTSRAPRRCARCRLRWKGRAPVSWGEDGNILVWDLSRHLPSVLLDGTPGQPAEEAMWQSLASLSAPAAYRLIAQLAAVPDRTVPILRRRLVGPAFNADRVAGLLDLLDSAEFRRRDAAFAELKRKLTGTMAFWLQRACAPETQFPVRRGAAARGRTPEIRGGRSRAGAARTDDRRAGVRGFE